VLSIYEDFLKREATVACAGIQLSRVQGRLPLDNLIVDPLAGESIPTRNRVEGFQWKTF